MQEKMLIVDQEKCTGCRQCEMVCSVFHNGASNPSRSRISVIKWENVGFYLPLTCQHCEDAACMSVCPKSAISRDSKLDRVMVNYDLCIGLQERMLGTTVLVNPGRRAVQECLHLGQPCHE